MSEDSDWETDPDFEFEPAPVDALAVQSALDRLNARRPHAAEKGVPKAGAAKPNEWIQQAHLAASRSLREGSPRVVPERDAQKDQPGPDDRFVEEYIRYGISAEGVLHVLDIFDKLSADATTNDLCQLYIKPYTTPHGWRDNPRLILQDDSGNDVAANGWYSHNYVDSSGHWQSEPPPATQSLCQKFAADPATSRFVGKPTHFLSHAWKFKIHSLAATLRQFAAARAKGTPPAFFWFDCLSLDQVGPCTFALF